MDTTIQGIPKVLLAGDYPDPSIVRVGQDYYMTHSSFMYGPGLLIWHSRNLVDWTPVGHALQQYIGDVWAPDIVCVDGRFYIYFPSNGTNYVVYADRPEGPWSEPIDLQVEGIDPGHLLTPEGERYLYLNFGRVVKLAPDGLSTVGEVQTVYDGWPIPEDWEYEGMALESPKLLVKGGYYYLISAQGGTAGPATSHMVVVARSRHPLGPWENSPYNPLVHTWSKEDRWWSKGHGTLFDTPEGDWYIVYHAYEKDYYTLGRQTLLEPVEWTEDGWPVLKSGADARTVSEVVSEGVTASVQRELSDDFQSAQLGWQWRFYKELDPSRYETGGGVLRLKGRGSSPADAGPLLCIPPDHAYEAEVEVRIDPQVEAGLVLFYNDRCYAGIGFDGQHLFRLRRAAKGFYQPGQGRSLHLKLRNDHHTVSMYYSKDGSEWVKFPASMEVSAYHHNAFGDFISLRLGVYAAGEGYAEFRNFRYRSLQ